MTPLIGITTYSDAARWRDWAVPAAVLPRTYVDAVRRAGGRPVLLPPGGTAAEAALTLADLDGLVVAGGEDVDPAQYGATMHPATGRPSAERDAWELALLDSALGTGRPLLAVCRGIQLLNVVRGGTLHQHLPHIVGHEEHSGVADDFGRHMVRIGEAGLIGKILGPNGTSPNGARSGGADGEGFDWPAATRTGAGHWLEVPTHHHQAVDRLGDGAGGHGLGGGRDRGSRRVHRGQRGGRSGLRHRRAVASGGRRGPAAVPRADRRGAPFSGLVIGAGFPHHLRKTSADLMDGVTRSGGCAAGS